MVKPLANKRTQHCWPTTPKGICGQEMQHSNSALILLVYVFFLFLKEATAEGVTINTNNQLGKLL